VLTKKIGAQGAVGCSRRVGSVRQAYQRPVWTARRMVQGGEAADQLDCECGGESVLRRSSFRLTNTCYCLVT